MGDSRSLIRRQRSYILLTNQHTYEGTNALLLTPPDVIAFDYGVGSFIRHCERARIAGAHLEVFEADSLALDLDLPEDLDLVGAALNMNINSGPMG